MFLLSKYGLAIHSAFVVAVAFFLPCFAPGAVSVIAVLCLCLLTVEWMVAEPSIRTGETRAEARARTFGAIARDPLFWISLIVLAVTLVRWINSGVRFEYFAGAGKWEIQGPDWPDAPCAADAGVGGGVFALFLAMSVSTLAARHAFGAKARAAFGISLALAAGIAGWCAVAMAACGSESAAASAKAAVGDSVCAGLPFGICLVAGIMACVGAEENGWRGGLFLGGFGLSGCAAALAVFSPPLISVVFLSAAAVCAVLAVFKGGVASALPGALRMFIASSIAFAGLFTGLLVLPDVAAAKADQCGDFLPESVAERKNAVSEISAGLWKDGKGRWVGSGTGTFGVRAKEYVSALKSAADRKKLWKALPDEIETARPVNFFKGFNTEHGMIGVMLALAWAAVAVFDWFAGLIRAFKTYDRGADDPAAVFAFPFLCWAAPLAVALFIFAGMFCMATECAALVPLSAVAALSASSFPKNGAKRRTAAVKSAPRENAAADISKPEDKENGR